MVISMQQKRIIEGNAEIEHDIKRYIYLPSIVWDSSVQSHNCLISDIITIIQIIIL